MTAAALWIVARKIPVERASFARTALGGAAGITAGTYLVAPHVPASYAKMSFVSLWLSYGIALFLINHLRGQGAVEALPRLGAVAKAELVAIGVIGGLVSSVVGSGLDICWFAFVTLRYRLSEKIATPTSVILMATNALVGTLLHRFVIADLQSEAVDYWLVSVPVVVLGAPFGAFVVSRISRLRIAIFLYAVIVAQFVGAVVILRPGGSLAGFSAAVFAGGLVLFLLVTRLGRSGRRDAGASCDE